MVFFTCTHCGEALKKPRVEKHFQFQCRNSISVSCMDCFKDFRGQEYVAHTKCITEAQRYGGKDFVAKPSKNKGERKQQDWILVVQSVIDTSENLSSAERNILNILSNHENVPRKKAKFMNFIKSVLAGRVNMGVVESVWGKMEEAFKKASQDKNVEGNSEGGLNSSKEQSTVLSNQADIIENENNENLSKEYKIAESALKQNGKSDDGGVISESTNGTIEPKSKKSKKRKMEENGVETQKNQNSDSKSKSEEKSEIDSTCLVEVEQNGIQSKKSKKRKVENGVGNLSTPAVNESENIADNEEVSFPKFDWNEAILKIVRSKEEISLKKLRKRVLGEYQTSSNKTTTEEKAAAKFDKKMNKISQIIVTNGKVKLVE